MHWILQTSLFKETEWDTLVATLERFHIPYSVHKVIPFIGDLLPSAEPKDKKVVCFGSYSMRHSAKKFGWTPGVYDLFETNFLVQREHWGDFMLNYDSDVKPFKDVILSDPTFIRPIDDSKYFAGKVFEPEEWNPWREGIVKEGYDYGNSLTPETLVQICTPKVIWSEYRYWVVDGEVVTKSLYKRGDKVIYSPTVDLRFDWFVYGCIAQISTRGWLPHKAFVIDVCETPDGIKVVEINTINSAGFYAGNIQDIVMALESMER